MNGKVVGIFFAILLALIILGFRHDFLILRKKEVQKKNECSMVSDMKPWDKVMTPDGAVGTVMDCKLALSDESGPRDEGNTLTAIFQVKFEDSDYPLEVSLANLEKVGEEGGQGNR